MHISLPGLLYEEDSFGVYLLITIILGGGAAWLTGRAIAQTWRPAWQAVFYALILSAAVRFIHYSLFDGTLLSLHYYLADSSVLLGFALVGFRKARTVQMLTQYRWINESAGPLRWRRKPQ